MLMYLSKIFISVSVILAVTEVAKFSPKMGAVILSLPLISVLSMSFLFYETGDMSKVAELAKEVAVLTVLSLAFFIGFIAMAKVTESYILAMAVSVAVMGITYAMYLKFSGAA